MPYIKKQDREQYTELLNNLAAKVPQDRTMRPGHMNYIVSKLIDLVYGKEMRYADYNEVHGMLHCADLEFSRRRTSPYEDLKIEQEGDI